MNSESDSIVASWSSMAWRRAPVALVLIAVLLTVLTLAAVEGGRRGLEFIGAALLVLELVGVFYNWRASRLRRVGATAWRLIAAARAATVCTIVCIWYSTSEPSASWWWIGAAAHMLMYLLFTAGVVIPAVRQATGRARAGMIAEIVTVTSAGFMLIWYFTLEPVLARGMTNATIVSIGWPLGDALLLACVVSLVLRRTKMRFSAPFTIFTIGLTLHLVADLMWLAQSTTGTPVITSPVVLFTMAIASLCMTVAPILTVAQGQRPFAVPVSRPPAWVTHLPMASVLLGCLLMLSVTILEGQLLPWGGLVSALIAMTCGAALRQLISVRDARDQLTTDTLTGLVNHAGLDEALSRASHVGSPATLLLIDLDGFKIVNDSYGHAVGDAFLIHVGRLIGGTIGTADVCARIGADEFAVLLTDARSAQDAAAAAKQILAACADHPMHAGAEIIAVRASIGIASATSNYDGKSLLRQADTALYNIKRAGSHGFAHYEPAMIDHRVADAALAQDLHHAVHHGELHVVYQPQIHLGTGRLLAAEALLRWDHPTRGPISPVQFIPVAERSGMINSIGLWVLEQALTSLMAITGSTGTEEPIHISVNLSPRQLREPTIVADILSVVERTGADPHCLVLEVTESALVDDSSGITALRELRQHGIRIAIDDFGTGFSSLQYLTRLPVDILKIDRSFVADLDGSPEGSAVAEAVIRLAQVLHLSTVAEGIETPQQATELRALGCHVGQGFLYAKPLTFAAFAAFDGVPRTVQTAA